MFTGGMREAASKEVKIQEHNPDIIMWVLLYIYRGSFRSCDEFNPWKYRPEDRSPVATFALVYACACEYEVAKMGSATLGEITKLTMWMSDDELVAAIPVIWMSTPETNRTVRNLFLSHAVKRAQEINKLDAFRDMVKEGGSLVSEFVDSVTKGEKNAVVEIEGYPVGDHMMWTHYHSQHSKKCRQTIYCQRSRRSNAVTDLQMLGFG
jgi:hypothetical protein